MKIPKSFWKWFRQPTTIHGIGVVAAGLGAGLSQVVTGNPKVDGAIAIIAYVACHLGINDNSSAEQEVTQVVKDIASNAPVAQTAADAAAAATAVASSTPSTQGPST